MNPENKEHMKKIHLVISVLWLLSLLYGYTPIIKAQTMGGTYTIGSASNADYATISDAVVALETNGIHSSVVFEIAEGSYEAFLTIGNIDGSSADNNISFKGMGAAPDAVTLTSNAGYTEKNTLKLDNAQHIHFENMMLTSTSNHYSTIVRFISAYKDISFVDVKFLGAEVTNSTYDDDKHLVFDEADTTVDEGLLFDNCEFVNGYMAISIQGQGYNKPNDRNVKIKNSSFVGQYTKSIWAKYIEDFEITNNYFSNSTDLAYEFNNIDMFRCFNHILIDGNTFVNTLSQNRFVAISCRPCTGAVDNPVLISNNMISGITNASSFSYGIYIKDDESAHLSILHNSIYFYGETGAFCGLFVKDDFPHLNVQNNMIVSKSTEGIMMWLKIAGPTDKNIDYNLYETVSDNIGKYKTSYVSSLQAWRDSTQMETHTDSLTLSSHFVANDNLHLNTESNIRLNNPLSLVPKDIDGELRSITQPCAGADEFASNLPPYLVTPFDSVLFANYPESQTVALNGHFEDPDGDPITIGLSNTSSNKISATIAGNVLTITREDNSESLSEWVELCATAGAHSVYAKIAVALLSTDQPPIIANLIEPQQFSGFPQTIEIDITAAFTDPDNNDEDMTYEALEIETSKYEVILNGTTMRLLRKTANAFSNSPFVLRAHSNGAWVDMTVAVSATASPIEAEVADFEEITLNAEGIWEAPNTGDNILIDKTWGFYNHTQEGYWGGFQVSSRVDTTQSGMDAQYTAITAGGFDSSSNYSVVYASYYPTDVFPQTGNATEVVKGMYVTNNLWAYQSMRDGDNLATAFGGDSGNEPDYFRIRAVGYDASDNAIDTLYFYLADYRFDDNSEDYIVDDWQYFDLSSLGEVSKIRFAMESSKNNQSGILTPAYFCMDNFNADAPQVDLPPEVIGELNITIEADENVVEGDLLTVVSDPDNEDADIVFTVVGGGNPAVADVSIVGSVLRVERATSNSAEFNLSIEALSNGKSVEFEVPVQIMKNDAIAEVAEDSQLIQLYPNPASDVLCITSNIKAHYAIYAADSKCVIAQKAMQQAMEQLDVSGLGKGIYLVKLKTANGLIVRKFVKQ